MKKEKEVSSNQWNLIRGYLREEVGDAAYKSWVKPMILTNIHNGEVSIGVPTRFMRDFVIVHYAERIRTLWEHINPAIRVVHFTVYSSSSILPSTLTSQQSRDYSNAVLPWSSKTDQPTIVSISNSRIKEIKPSENKPVTMSSASSAGSVMRKVLSSIDSSLRSTVEESVETTFTSTALNPGTRGAISASLDVRFTFSNFVVSRSNEFAHAAARSVADSDRVSFNPLFLYGGVGSGKTHLMQAIAWQILGRIPVRTVIYLSAEKFMYRFVQALRFQNIMFFKEQLRSADVLIIDDVQFIAGKEATQKELFHTFNTLVEQGCQIIISADQSPDDLCGIEESLRSRLGWGLVADIHDTTYELRFSILQNRAKHLGITVPKPVLEFLASKISSNIRNLEGALNRITAHAQLVGHDITMEITRELLKDLLRSHDHSKPVTIEGILLLVAKHFAVKMSDISSARRVRSVVRSRQVAMYLAKTLTSCSLPEIGRRIGNRDHSTVIHAVRKIEELIRKDLGFAEKIASLKQLLLKKD